MGLDYGGIGDGITTDSMMLVTLDPVARTAGMLSIPGALGSRSPASNTTASTPPISWASYNLPGGGPNWR
jgi:hypothetical protein